jgi:TonB-dependent SusC/RagA subfamily outer membrane receptor
LKDAAATAIYGSRFNGVILITKRGKLNQAEVTLSKRFAVSAN